MPVRRGADHPRWNGGKSSHPLNDTYTGMLCRCYWPGQTRYDSYGGRGITVCERWRNDFWAFVADVGERPAGRSLDRIDNDGNYEPGNVRWATAVEQRGNRRPVERSTVCKNGHEFSAENTYARANGRRTCTICRRAYERRVWPRKKARLAKSQQATR